MDLSEDMALNALTREPSECSPEYPSVITDEQLQRLMPLSLEPPRHPLLVQALGQLDSLPGEILYDILEDLPLSDLMSFREVNESTKHIVHGMFRFRIIVDHAPQTLRGVLAMQNPVKTTLLELFDKLCQRYCDHCAGKRSLARYLCVVTNSRRCTRCPGATSSKPYGPLLQEETIEIFEVSKDNLSELISWWFPVLRFTDGRTVIPEHPSRKILYGGKLARPLCHELKKTKPKWSEIWVPTHIKAYDPSTEMPWMTVLNCEHNDLRGTMTTVVAPWISFDSHGDLKIESGVYCSACLHTEREFEFYTMEEFKEHLRDCRVTPFDGFRLAMWNASRYQHHGRFKLSLAENQKLVWMRRRHSCS
ncbi:hypothetical protein K491DRAFT_776037 [Lophiostoma macrostomum CBS 122681]|uniref:F-box domain-containing protein n=1 Tax=Lophiostoma macrostomum CBS 122681 TaxID=1314788 RepID=A0A6A6THL3_9PLEO|nr:hypothetical protein K491DRAFT_776037 [Lophiostoma macrostomum CBS 122681]